MQKRPRHYAADIIALPTAEQRRAAVAQVPEEVRDRVTFYVVDYFQKRRRLKAYRIQQANSRCY